MKSKKNERTIRLESLVIVCFMMLAQWLPILYYMIPICIIGSTLYLYVHADDFSGYAKGSPRWRTYRYLVVFGIVISMAIYILGMFYQHKNMENTSGMQLIFIVFVATFGNLAPRIPWNTTLGLRLPWTVADEQNWRYAHRIVGYCTIPCVFIMLLAYIVKEERLFTLAFFLWISLPILLSYRAYTPKEKEPILMKAKFYDPRFLVKIVFVIAMIVTFCLFPFLPNDLPMQFSNSGEVNWTMPKYFGVFLLPAIAAFLSAYYMKDDHFDFQKLILIILLLLIQIGFLCYIAFFM